MKGFKDDEKRKLAIITGIFLGNGFCSAKVLSSIFEEHLVKDGMFYIILRIAVLHDIIETYIKPFSSK